MIDKGFPLAVKIDFMAFKFESLIVWQKAVDLSGDISELVKTLPKEELYVLTAQIKRACDSISLKVQQDRLRLSLRSFWAMQFGHQLK